MEYHHIKSPLGFEKNNFRSENISWDLTIYNANLVVQQLRLILPLQLGRQVPRVHGVRRVQPVQRGLVLPAHPAVR